MSREKTEYWVSMRVTVRTGAIVMAHSEKEARDLAEKGKWQELALENGELVDWEIGHVSEA